MSFDGVWQIDILGPYGWQAIGTAFLLGGKYHAAGDDHHAVGTYQSDGDSIEVHVDVTQHGTAQTVFGETTKHIEALIEGKLEEPDKITGRIHPRKHRDYDLRLRMTRVDTLS